MTVRNRGLIGEDEQQRLRWSELLVAGCGSIGGAVVEPLIRLGAERLVLAEPDVFELHNLNRQHAGLADVGSNKARTLAVWARDVNPNARITVHTAGITADNVAGLIDSAAVVFDGVDVTAAEALHAKYLLHQHAQQARVPVVSGYDIAGVQLVLVYDYRCDMPILAGRISPARAARLDPMRFLARVLPLSALPVEILTHLRQQQPIGGRAGGEQVSFPQLVYTARLFGVIASRVALDLLAGRPVRHRILVDVHDLPRTTAARWRTRAARLGALVRLAPTALAYRR